jgi:hypothetical protein
VFLCVCFNWNYLLPQLLLQVLALADKSQAELRRSIADLTKKCDDLLRHKRFLANQAAESSAFSAAAKRKKSRKSLQGGDGDEEVHGAGLGAVHGGEVEVHSEDEEAGEAGGEDDLECAVCRSAMSEELQVRVLVTQKVTQVSHLQTSPCTSRCCLRVCLDAGLAGNHPTNAHQRCLPWFLCLQVFPCGHYFCDGCAQQQLAAASPSCPYCRKHVTKAGVFRVSLAGSGAHDPEILPPEGAALRDIKVNASAVSLAKYVQRFVLGVLCVSGLAPAHLVCSLVSVAAGAPYVTSAGHQHQGQAGSAAAQAAAAYIHLGSWIPVIKM